MYDAFQGNLALVKYLVEDLGMRSDIKASGRAYGGLNALGYAEKQLTHYGSAASGEELEEVIACLKTK